METVEHFAYGWWTPAASYAMSFLGSLFGLRSALQARLVKGPGSFGWLVLAALCIGGTGIWAMHFIAMMGFAVPGTVIRYDVVLTLASGVLAVIVVGAGLTIATRRPTWGGLVAGGVVTGLGVCGMHYLGMASIQMNGHLHHDLGFVTAAVGIAVAAATAALFFALRVRGGWASLGAAALMGVAVNSMHYTGMFGVSAEVNERGSLPDGASGLDFFLPLFAALGALLLVAALALMLAPTEEEVRSDQFARQWLAARNRDPKVPLDTTPSRPPQSGPDRGPQSGGGMFTPRSRR